MNAERLVKILIADEILGVIAGEIVGVIAGEIVGDAASLADTLTSRF